MRNSVQELTGVQAGLSTQRQLEIALETVIDRSGTATNEDIYTAIERHMNGAILSQQG